MIRIEHQAWESILTHAAASYPDECCGAMLGRRENGAQAVTLAVPLENAAAGAKGSRYEIRPEDLLKTENLARRQGLTSIGIYHSHPDADAYAPSLQRPRSSSGFLCGASPSLAGSPTRLRRIAFTFVPG